MVKVKTSQHLHNFQMNKLIELYGHMIMLSILKTYYYYTHACRFYFLHVNKTQYNNVVGDEELVYLVTLAMFIPCQR